MNWKFVARAAFVGVAGLLASLQANLPGLTWDDLIAGLIAGGLLALSYAGIGAATPLEPSVGKKS